MPYQDFAKFNVYELGDKTACDQIVDDLLGHMTTPMQSPATGATPTVAVNVGSKLCYVFDLNEPATGNYDLLMPPNQSFTVLGAYTIKGVAGGTTTVTVMNGANVVVGAITPGATDKAIVVGGDVDDAHATVAGGGTLRLAIANGGAQSTCRVVVEGILSA